ncbi:MAG: putative sugar nucleotidyl transferase [Planctomycetota bacterium]
MNIVVFEDAGVTQLHPITLSRPAYAISCASFRLIDRLLEFETTTVGLVRPYLERIQMQDFHELSLELDKDQPMTLMVNARTAPTVANLAELNRLYQSDWQSSEPKSVLLRSGWAISAALVPTSQLLASEPRQWLAELESTGSHDAAQPEGQIKLFEYPHDVISENLAAFESNLAFRIAVDQRGEPRFKEVQPNVFLGRHVHVSDHVVMDGSTGPIIIDDGVKIGPFSFFRGPLYIGPNSKISEHASIKDGVSVQHTCKIGGEVEGTILEAYTNKQHHGFLGHSYLGSWINLGAGTCNSDLKNTYGTVNMEYHGEKVSTGLQFVGCIMGDYAKTAINTSIFTGKTIGVASMIYGFATTNVPSFVNYARTFNETGVLPPEVVVTTQKRMFARRNVEQRPCDIQLIHDIYQLTAAERADDLSNEPLSL